MVPGLIKRHSGVMYDQNLFLYLQFANQDTKYKMVLLPFHVINRSDIRAQVNWAINLVTADGHSNIPQGFVCAS